MHLCMYPATTTSTQIGINNGEVNKLPSPQHNVILVSSIVTNTYLQVVFQMPGIDWSIEAEGVRRHQIMQPHSVAEQVCELITDQATPSLPCSKGLWKKTTKQLGITIRREHTWMWRQPENVLFRLL